MAANYSQLHKSYEILSKNHNQLTDQVNRLNNTITGKKKSGKTGNKNTYYTPRIMVRIFPNLICFVSWNTSTEKKKNLLGII